MATTKKKPAVTPAPATYEGRQPITPEQMTPEGRRRYEEIMRRARRATQTPRRKGQR